MKIKLFFTLVFCSIVVVNASDGWKRDRYYRLKVIVETGNHALHDKIIETDLDLSAKLSKAGAPSHRLHLPSLCVIEVDDRGRYIQECPAQWDVDRLLWMMPGVTPTNEHRFFEIYFNDSGHPTTPSSVNALVQKTDAPERWQFTTPGGYYVFEKRGGAFEVFSPVPCEDNESGKDWMRDDYNKWNGILNVGDPETKAIFHPNEDEEAIQSLTKGPRSQLVYAGPLRYRIKSINRFGKLENDYRSGTVYEILYDIFPYGVRATMTKGNPHGYACIMELTPGGDSSELTDFVVRADGLRKMKNEKWAEDISPEWLYVGDAEDANKLYFLHVQDDTIKDGLNWYENMQAVMVGWGRGANPGIHSYPNTFYFGFTQLETHQEIESLMASLSHEPKITFSKTERRSRAKKQVKRSSWYLIDPDDQTIANSHIAITFGPDKFVQGNRVRGLTRFEYLPTGENFANVFDAHGCGYAEYMHMDGTTTFVAKTVDDTMVQADVSLQGCAKVRKSYRLYRDLPVLEIVYDQLDLLWWEDWYAMPPESDRLYTIFGIPEDMDSTHQALFREIAEKECGHNFGDCFLKAAGSSVAQSTYKDHLIFGFFRKSTQRGLGFIIPARIGVHNGFKLWSMFNYETFPFYQMVKELPLKRWIFITTSGGDGILTTGKAIVDLELQGQSIKQLTKGR